MKLPLGYRYAAAYGGIRKQKSDDIALIVPDKPAHAAALFTTNRVQASPVCLARKHLRTSKGKVVAVLINAGNANCATRTGNDVAAASCKAAAKALDTKAKYILPASTGVIGVELDPRLLTDPLPGLISKLAPDAFEAVARAIMTTDTRVKIAVAEIPYKSGKVRIAGMAKGSGMIHPNMATTLGFVMTDADVVPEDLHEMLGHAADRSFHALTVDGDMSTNDTVVLLANGASKVKPSHKERKALQDGVTQVMTHLAKQIAADGEGARKLIIVRVEGFKNDDDARKVARSISNSPLVKTAVAGSDPNWGRILAAAGYSGASFNPVNVDIYLQDVLVCRKGLAADIDEAKVKQKLDKTEVGIRIVEKTGKGRAQFFTCDLTEGYIRINGSYRT